MDDVRGSKRSGRLRFSAAIAAVIAVAAPAPVLAQPRPAAAGPRAAADVEGAVLAIQGEELVVDLGAARGAADGMQAELWRPVKLKHPVTGKVLTDRFRIGALELVQVRGNLSLAKAAGPLSRPPEIGDVAVLASARQAPPGLPPTPGATPPPSPDRPPDPAAPPEDPDARSVTEMFESLRGADLATRIARYEGYARRKPESRFARTLQEEAAALRELVTSRERKAVTQARAEARHFSRPEEVLAGSPLRLAIELNDVATGAILHVRRRGAATYVSMPMSPIGAGYFAATIPADSVVAPSLELFIEGVTASGQASSVWASSASPSRIDVFAPPPAAGPRHLPLHAEVAVDFADYNRLRGNDYVFQTEGSFGVRYGDTGVRALRLGFGVYRGKGGSVDDLDLLNLAGRKVGLTYGYLEVEWGFIRAFSLITRGAVGLVDRGVSGGGQLLLRIGSDLGTNLMLGGEILGGVGLRSIVQLELATFDRFPITLRSEVTNQPAGVTQVLPDDGTSGGSGNVGVRGIAQLGFKITPDLVIAARGSFQGRTIQHAGPGVGGAVGYSW